MAFVKQTMLLPKPHEERYSYYSLTDEELLKLPAELTEDEKKAVHAKYYNPALFPLSGLHQNIIDRKHMIDHNDAFDIRDYGKNMNNTGYCKEENGYCVLENGVTYAAFMLKQPGRTPETVEYYNNYFAPEGGLFYKIWYPGEHYVHFTDGCLENFGFGRIKMKFEDGIDVTDLGIDPKRLEENDPACIAICGTVAKGRNLDGDDPKKEEWSTIIFYHRQTEIGREMRIRLWYGEGFTNHELHLTPPQAKDAEQIAAGTFAHMAHEYTNDEYLERMFWNDTHPCGGIRI